MTAVDRHPYKIVTWLHTWEGCFLTIRPVDMSIEFGMSVRLKSLLDGLTTCTRCKQPCMDVARHFSCEGEYVDRFVDGTQVKWASDVTLVLPVANADRVIEATRYDKACSTTFLRTLRTKEGGKRATTREVQELLKVQGGRCYYCYRQLVDPGGTKVQFHRDHYVSLADGGTNQIVNLVLACSLCNTQKNNLAGSVFATFSLIGLPAETQALLSKLHDAVRDWQTSRAR